MPDALKDLDRIAAKAKALSDAADAAEQAFIAKRKAAREAQGVERTKLLDAKKAAAQVAAKALVTATMTDEESRVLFGFLDRVVTGERNRKLLARVGFLSAPSRPEAAP